MLSVRNTLRTPPGHAADTLGTVADKSPSGKSLITTISAKCSYVKKYIYHMLYDAMNDTSAEHRRELTLQPPIPKLNLWIN